jgi:nucleoside phosphorylase
MVLVNLSEASVDRMDDNLRTIVWVMPLGSERKVFQQALDTNSENWVKVTTITLPTFRHQHQPWIIIESGQGKIQAGLASLLAASNFSPEFIFLCGTATALDPTLSVGSWLLTSESLEWDFGNSDSAVKDSSLNKAGMAKVPLFKTPEKDLEQGKLILGFSPSQSLPMGWTQGGCVSADRNWFLPEEKSRLYTKTSGRAAAWEGAGLARFRKLNLTSCMEIRMITESAEEGEIPWDELRKRMKTGFRVLAERLLGNCLE